MNNAGITRITGKAIPLRGNDIDTDRIVPARYLRCVTFDGLGKHAFEDDRAQNPDHPFNQEKFRNANILIVGKNFGCGSSREHAPQSLSKWGITGIIGESFAEIFFANCQAMGIPCFTVSNQDCNHLFQTVESDPDSEIAMDLENLTITAGKDCMTAGISESALHAFIEGTWNATAVLLQAGEKIDQKAACLPYLNNFATV